MFSHTFSEVSVRVRDRRRRRSRTILYGAKHESIGMPRRVFERVPRRERGLFHMICVVVCKRSLIRSRAFSGLDPMCHGSIGFENSNLFVVNERRIGRLQQE